MLCCICKLDCRDQITHLNFTRCPLMWAFLRLFKNSLHFPFISCILNLYRLARQLINKGNKMKITFNEYTMNKAALFSNGLQIIEQHGRFLLCKEYKGQYKVFLNTSSFDYAIQYGQKM